MACGMNPRHLRSLIAVADFGSVSEAARRLNVTQPALSRQIRDVETRLGLKLFERVGHGMVPTGEGEEFLRHGRELLEQSDDLEEHARMLAHGEAGVLRVGATPQTIESFLAPFIRSYRGSYRNVRVRLVEAGGAQQLDLIEQGKTHLAITAVTGDPALFATRALGDVNLVVAAEPRSRLAPARAKRLEIAGLAGAPLLLLNRGYASRELFEAACRLSDLRPNIYMESASPHTLLALAQIGLGAAVLPSHVHLAGRRLRTLRLMHDGEFLRLPFGISWRRHRHLPRYAEAFIDQLTIFAKGFDTTLMTNAP